MRTLLQLPDFPNTTSDSDPVLVKLGFDWADLVRLWQMILALAIRDGAASLHYHPWRTDGHLSYIVDGVRYEMIPPPPELARQVATAAGSLICGNRVGAACRRWLGWPVTTVDRVQVVFRGTTTEWAGVVWSAGGVVGVEWFRTDSIAVSTNPLLPYSQ